MNLVACTLLSALSAQEEPSVPLRSQPWDPEIVALAETLPIQEDGRLKPLGTYASFTLLQLNGTRRFEWVRDQGTETPDDDVTIELSPTEWLLDCVFFPEQSADYPCFQLQTSEVADAIGVAHDKKKKRARYSYVELSPGRMKLMQMAETIEHEERDGTRDAKNRTYLDAQIVGLAKRMEAFEGLIGALSFARREHLASELPAQLGDLLGPASELRYSTILTRSPALIDALDRAIGTSTAKDPKDLPPDALAINDYLVLCDQLARLGVNLAIFPPADPKELEWQSVWGLFNAAFPRPTRANMNPAPPAAPGPHQVAALDALGDAFAARGNQPAMKAALTRVHAEVTGLAAARGEGAKIASEVSFYKANLFFYAQWLYVLGFVVVAAGWLARPDWKVHRFLPYALMVPLAVQIAGITWRCYLRARPPVSTLYETILFISCVGVMAALIVELIDRRRIAVGFAALLGAAGLFIAASYEAKDAYDNGVDTMPQLQAVLDTNFWLSTHVTTVTIGYSAGLLAAFLAHVYVFGRLFGLRKGDPNFYRSVARMVYGVICFGLLFSVVGTILGGVWANDSWGRFWGWDPKENGALMIVLWELAILHGRMGGYIRDLGVCVAAIFGGTIVAFSWWHVNLLGIGLHAYGFTHGLLGKLWSFYGVEWLIVLAGIWIWLGERAHRKAMAMSAAGPGSRKAFQGPVVEPLGSEKPGLEQS